MIILKRVLSVICWLFCALMAYTVATAPMIVIAGPAFLMVTAGAGGWLFWRSSNH